MRMAVAGFWWLVACGAVLSGQSLTIGQAVEGALKNYPAIRISQEQLTAASAGIQLARTSYLPRLDLLAQANRATRNNVFGLLLPQNVISSMSGPVIGSNNFGTAWGSAAGVLVSWEPFDFGLRRANIAMASATRSEAEATLRRTRYDIAVATADAYLTLAASEETVRAAQAGVDRADTVLRTIQALANSGLRPGADASRAQAELAAARTQWIQAKQSTEVARATISQFVGGEPSQITLAAPKLRELPPVQDSAAVNVSANPIAVEQDAVLDRTKAELRALERTYFPRFSLQGSAYARGTGAETDGALLGGLNGLGPNVQNYAVGFTVTFPAMDLPALQARRAMQSANVRAETARSQQIATDLKARWNAATARMRGAREVAANTPVQVSAARAALQQSTARYQSGLANIDEMVEAQRLLTQAEIDDSLARLSVWRGLLEIATIAGDLQPFLMEASQ